MPGIFNCEIVNARLARESHANEARLIPMRRNLVSRLMFCQWQSVLRPKWVMIHPVNKAVKGEASVDLENQQATRCLLNYVCSTARVIVQVIALITSKACILMAK